MPSEENIDLTLLSVGLRYTKLPTGHMFLPPEQSQGLGRQAHPREELVTEERGVNSAPSTRYGGPM